jgi:transcriptional regulator of acetoin/glycerol metabolism
VTAVELSPSPLRPEIALSWRRSSLSGLDPATPVAGTDGAEVTRRSRLLDAAAPVLDRLAGELAGTGFCLMLADRDATLVDLRPGTRRVGASVEAIGAEVGRRFTEDTSGTNSIATSHELRAGVAVHGQEHYLEALKPFSCYGRPLLQPATRRTAGVLDITCLAADDSALLGPYLHQAVHEIEARLLETAGITERRALAAFQAAAAGASHAVLVLHDDVVLADTRAAALVCPADHATLRRIGERLGPQSEATCTVELVNGVAPVRVRRVEGVPSALVIEIGAADGAASGCLPTTFSQRLDAELDRLRRLDAPVVIAGEPGTGRSTAAARLAGAAPLATLDAADLVRTGPAGWLARAHALAGRAGAVVVVDEVQLLPDTVAAALRRIIDGARARPVFVAGPDELDGQRAALTARGVERIDLPPLRHRLDELPDLVRGMLERLSVPSVRLGARSLEALGQHRWPGNLTELSTVLATAVRGRRLGEVTVGDLPRAYREPAPSHLSRLERVERDAIVDALRSAAGNKVQAAGQLGISRTTLYARMRAYRIDT